MQSSKSMYNVASNQHHLNSKLLPVSQNAIKNGTHNYNFMHIKPEINTSTDFHTSETFSDTNSSQTNINSIYTQKIPCVKPQTSISNVQHPNHQTQLQKSDPKSLFHNSCSQFFQFLQKQDLPSFLPKKWQLHYRDQESDSTLLGLLLAHPTNINDSDAVQIKSNFDICDYIEHIGIGIICLKSHMPYENLLFYLAMGTSNDYRRLPVKHQTHMLNVVMCALYEPTYRSKIYSDNNFLFENSSDKKFGVSQKFEDFPPHMTQNLEQDATEKTIRRKTLLQSIPEHSNPELQDFTPSDVFQKPTIFGNMEPDIYKKFHVNMRRDSSSNTKVRKIFDDKFEPASSSNIQLLKNKCHFAENEKSHIFDVQIYHGRDTEKSQHGRDATLQFEELILKQALEYIWYNQKFSQPCQDYLKQMLKTSTTSNSHAKNFMSRMEVIT